MLLGLTHATKTQHAGPKCARLYFSDRHLPCQRIEDGARIVLQEIRASYTLRRHRQDKSIRGRNEQSMSSCV